MQGAAPAPAVDPTALKTFDGVNDKDIRTGRIKL
jgi:hypothetical protein